MLIKNKSVIIIVALSLVSFMIGGIVTIMSNNKVQPTFFQDGYLLSDLVEETDAGIKTTPLRFRGGEVINTDYKSKVFFRDEQNERVYADEYSFIHYVDDSIGAFAPGVMLDLDSIERAEAINYYNITPDSIVQKSGNLYAVEHMGNLLTFKNYIWKLKPEKLMLVSDELLLKLSEEDQRSFRGYLEVDFVDMGIIKISNNEETIFTISPECSVVLANDVIVDFNSEMIYKGNTQIPLSQMIVNADDNIDVVSVPENQLKGIKIPTFIAVDGEEGEAGTAGDEGKVGEVGNEGSSGDEGTAGNQGRSGSSGSGGQAGQAGSTAGGASSGSGSSSSSSGNMSDKIIVPLFTLNPKINSTDFETEVNIEDPEGRLEDTLFIKIYDTLTREVVYTETNLSGALKFDINAAGCLTPGREYRLLIEGSYLVDGESYKKAFVDKAFFADDIGLTLLKYAVGTKNISIRVKQEAYSTITSANIKCTSLKDGTEFTMPIVSFNPPIILTFSGLNPDEEYEFMLVDLVAAGNVHISEYNVPITIRTLKDAVTVTQAPYVYPSRLNNLIEVMAKGVTDPMNAIKQYRYEFYDSSDFGLSGNLDAGAEPKKVAYSDNGKVLGVSMGAGLDYGVGYRVRVVVEYYDNDKLVEVASPFSDVVRMSGAAVPHVTFDYERDASDNPILYHDAIRGNLRIEMGTADFQINPSTPLKIEMSNSVGTTFTKKISVASTPGVGNVMTYALDENALRQNDQINIAVWATVDLHDGVGFQELRLGTATARTKDPNTLRMAFSDIAGSSTSADFSFYLKFIDGDTGSASYEASTLRRITLNLYQNTPYNDDGTKKTPLRTVYLTGNDGGTYNSTLGQDIYSSSRGLIIDNTTLSTNEAFYETYGDVYTVEVVHPYDYTVDHPVVAGAYANEIGLLPDPTTQKNYYEFIVNVNNMPKLPANPNDALTITEITVKEALSNQITQYFPDIFSDPTTINDKYRDDTVIAYRVVPNYNNATNLAEEFTLNMYKLPAYDNRAKTVNLLADTDVKSWVTNASNSVGQFVVTKPTSASGWDGNTPTFIVLLDGTGAPGPGSPVQNRYIVSTSSKRGEQYFFTFTAKLKLRDEMKNYPEDHDDYIPGMILYSKRQDAPRQTAEFTMYPWSSAPGGSATATSEATWKYLAKDIDQSVVDLNSPGTLYPASPKLRLGSTGTVYFPITVNDNSYQEVRFTGLSNANASAATRYYAITYQTRLYNSTGYTPATTQLLQRYHDLPIADSQGITFGPSSAPILPKFAIESRRDINKIFFRLDDLKQVSSDMRRRIAALQVTYQDTGATLPEKVVYLPIDYDNYLFLNGSGISEKFPAAVMTFGEVGSDYIDKTLRIKASLMYDTGLYGYSYFEAGKQYSLQVMEDASMGQYALPNGSAMKYATDAMNGYYQDRGPGSHTGPSPARIGTLPTGSLNYKQSMFPNDVLGTVNLRYNNWGAAMGGNIVSGNLSGGTYLTPKLIGYTAMKSTSDSDEIEWMLPKFTPEIVVTSTSTTLISGTVNFTLKNAQAAGWNRLELRLYSDPGLTTLVSTQFVTIGPDTTPYTVNFAGLSPGTTYYVKIRNEGFEAPVTVGSSTDPKDALYDTRNNVLDNTFTFTTVKQVNITAPFSVVYKPTYYSQKLLEFSFNISQTIGVQLYYEFTNLNTHQVSGFVQSAGMITASSSYPIKLSMLQGFDAIPGSWWRFGNDYTVRIVATLVGGDPTNSDHILGQNTFNFHLDSLRTPMFSATATANLTADVHSLTVKTVPIDADKSIVNDKYKIRIFLGNTDVTASTGVNPDTVYTTGQALQTVVFGNLDQNTVYTIRYYAVTDLANNGGMSDISTITGVYQSNPTYDNLLIKQITVKTMNQTGVSMGETSAQSASTDHAKLVFTNTVNFDRAAIITYTISNSNGTMTPITQTRNFTPTLQNSGTSNEFYEYQIPELLSGSGPYFIEVELRTADNSYIDRQSVIFTRSFLQTLMAWLGF